MIWMIFAGLVTLALGTVSYIGLIMGGVDNSEPAQEKRFFACINDGDLVKGRKKFLQLKKILTTGKLNGRQELLAIWEPVLERLSANLVLPDRENNLVDVDIENLKGKLKTDSAQVDQVACRALLEQADKFASEYKYGRACDILRFIGRETASLKAVTHKREDELNGLFPQVQIRLARMLLAQAVRSRSVAPAGAVFAVVEEARRAFQVCQNLDEQRLAQGLSQLFNSDELTLSMAQCLAMDADFVGAEKILRKTQPIAPSSNVSGAGQLQSISACELKFRRGRMLRETGRYKLALATFKGLVEEASRAGDFDLAAASVEEIYTICDDCYLWHDGYGYLLDVLASKPDEKVQASCHAGLAALFFKMADNKQWAENLLAGHKALAVELKDKDFRSEGLKESNTALVLGERNWPPVCLLYSRALENRLEYLGVGRTFNDRNSSQDINEAGAANQANNANAEHKLDDGGKAAKDLIALLRLKAAAADADLLCDQIDVALVLENQARVNYCEDLRARTRKENDKTPWAVIPGGTSGGAGAESGLTGSAAGPASFPQFQIGPLLTRATAQSISWPVHTLPYLIKLKGSGNLTGEEIRLTEAVQKAAAELGDFYGADSLPRALELEYLSRLYISCGKGPEALAAGEKAWQIAARSKTFALNVRRDLLITYLDSLRAVGRHGAAEHLRPMLRGLSVCL